MKPSNPESKVSSAPKAAPKTAAPKTAPEPAAGPRAERVLAPAESGEAQPQIDRLAALFRDPAADSSESAEAGESPVTGEAAERPTKAKPPKGLKDLAERLELDPEALYAIEVPTSDGKTKTIGQLKDIAAKEGDLSVRELQIEEQRTQREADLLTAQNELRELVSALPRDAIKPEVLNAIRRKHEATMQTERARTLDLIPEWKNEQRRTEDLAGMVEHLKAYGFPANYLATVFDSRAIKYIRESWQREQRIRKALEQVQSASPAATKASKPNGAAKRPATASRSKSVDTNSERLRALFS